MHLNPLTRRGPSQAAFEGDSRFFRLKAHDDLDDDDPMGAVLDKGLRARKGCTIPCGGVGHLPREKAGGVKTACSSCTRCDKNGNIFEGSTQTISSKSECEGVGCCRWEEGKIYGGYCNAADTGQCKADSDSADMLSTTSSISCKSLPTLGVSDGPDAHKEGFVLRECPNPTDVCVSYCVASQTQELANHEAFSCSFGCLPQSIQTAKGQMNATDYVEEIFKTSLARENDYWCDNVCEGLLYGKGPCASGSYLGGTVETCKLISTDNIKKRDASCTKDCLYTGPSAVGTQGLCNRKDKDPWGCKFQICNTTGCNFSGAPYGMSAPSAVVGLISTLLSLAFVV